MLINLTRYATGKSVDVSLQEAFKYYLMASEKGHTDAMFNLSLALLRGEGCSKNEPLAAHWLQVAALQGLFLFKFAESAKTC